MTMRQVKSLCCGALTALACMLGAPSMAGELGPTDAEPPRTRLQTFTDRASELVMRAMGLIGIRYKYGGDSPEHGLDCSGLVRHVFKEAFGLILPRTSEEISKVGEKIDTADLQPGDLVFYNTLRRSFSHVGIYLGDKKFIHSPSSGGEVRIESMDVGYWKKRFNGARRINDPQRPEASLQPPIQPVHLLQPQLPQAH
jgi:cell wall-associated NlpC family hydrolase